MTPFVRIVVLNYDGGDMTLRCLRSLTALDWPRDRLEIVMVDNASIDGLVWKVPRMFPNVQVIESLENEGFARGNNLALQELSGVDYVALVNNDAYVDPNWLKAMVGGFSDEKVGATCSKMLFDREFVGFSIDTGDRSVDITAIMLNGHDVTATISFDERVKVHHAEVRHFTVDKRGSFYVEAGDFSLPATFEICLHSDENIEIVLSSSQTNEHVIVGDTEVSITIQANSAAASSKAFTVATSVSGNSILANTTHRMSRSRSAAEPLC